MRYVWILALAGCAGAPASAPRSTPVAAAPVETRRCDNEEPIIVHVDHVGGASTFPVRVACALLTPGRRPGEVRARVESPLAFEGRVGELEPIMFMGSPIVALHHGRASDEQWGTAHIREGAPVYEVHGGIGRWATVSSRERFHVSMREGIPGWVMIDDGPGATPIYGWAFVRNEDVAGFEREE